MCFVSCDASPDLNQTLTSLEANSPDFSWMTTNCRFHPLDRLFHFFQNIYLLVVYIKYLKKKVVVKSCTVYCNCVCWEHGKGGWKVLLFSVALDTHLLSVPIPISSRLGHRPFSASEPFRVVFSLSLLFFFCLLFLVLLPGPGTRLRTVLARWSKRKGEEAVALLK